MNEYYGSMSITGETTHSKLIGYCLLIFGFTGAHRFYYGKTITGTIWFFTLGLFGIGWIIDIFLMPRIARNADQRFETGAYNYSVAWLLHTYSGVFGAHRFYLGKWITGIIYLCTAGLAGIGVIYDFYTLNSRVNEKNLTEGSPWWDRFMNRNESALITHE